MAEQITDQPKGTAVDVFSVLNQYDKKYALPRGSDFSFNPGMTKQFFAGFNTFKEALPPGTTFTMPPRAEAWEKWGNDPMYGGDQAKFNASFDHAAAISHAVNTQQKAIEASLALRFPVQELAQQIGMSKKVEDWTLGEQDQFQFGQTRPGSLGPNSPGTSDSMERMLVAKGVYKDPFGAEKPLYKENLDGFDNGTLLVADYGVDAYGRIMGKPQLRQTMYGDLPAQERIMSSWNIQSRSDGALSALANQIGSAIWTAPGEFGAMSKQLKNNLIDALYGPDSDDIENSKGLASTYDQLLNGKMPSTWDPQFDRIGGYRDLMKELDGGGYDLVREVEASPDWFANQARLGDKRAQRGVELHNMIAGTHDTGMSILDKLSGMYSAKAISHAYKPSASAEADPWSVEAVSGTVGNAFGQLVPAIAISMATAGALTAPALVETATKIASKQGLKWYGARKAAELFLAGSKASIAKTVAGQSVTRTLSTGGQYAARVGAMGHTSAFLAGQGYKSALQAGYKPEDAASFGLALLPLMFASEGIGSSYLINRFMSKGSGKVLDNMVKELGVNAPSAGASVSNEFIQSKALKVASNILLKGGSFYKSVTDKLGQSAFGNAAFGALAEGGQEVTEEILDHWAERWFDKNIGTEAGGVGRFGPEFNMSDRLGLAFLAGGIVGGTAGGVLGGRKGQGLDQTIGELVSSGRAKEVLRAADELLKAGSIDQDLHNMIKQEVGLVKDYNNRMDLSDPWLMDMLGSSRTGLTSEFNQYNKQSRDDQEALSNLRAKLSDPETSGQKKSELEKEISVIESREAYTQERINEFVSGKRVVHKLLEAESIRQQLFGNPDEREKISGTVDSAMQIHDTIKKLSENLEASVQEQSLKIQELTGATSQELLQKNDKLFKEVKKLGEGLATAVVSGNPKSVDLAVNELVKHLSGLRKNGIAVSDFDTQAIGSTRELIQESLDEVYSKIDNIEEPVGSDEWRSAGLKRTNGYKVSEKEEWLGTNADEVIADMEKLKGGIEKVDRLESELTAAHGTSMLTLDELNDPSTIMDRAVNMFLTTVDGKRTLGDIEGDLTTLLHSGEDMKEAAAEVESLIAPLQDIIMKKDAVNMLTDILPDIAQRVNIAHSGKVADEGLKMQGGDVVGSNLRPYHRSILEMSNDPSQQGLSRAVVNGTIQGMTDSIGRIVDLIQSINAAGSRRGDFLRGIQKARLEYRHELIVEYGGPELGGLTEEDLSSFSESIKNLDLENPNDLIKYEKAIERTEERLHDIVSKSGVSKFYKAVNAKLLKDVYGGKVVTGYFENRISGSDIDPTTYSRQFKPGAPSRRTTRPIATVAWSARIGYGPSKARSIFIEATGNTRAGNSTPNIEQEMALIDAHSMAHAPNREILLSGLYSPPKTEKMIEARLVSVFGFAGTGKTSMNPFLIRMASIHRGSKPRTLIVVPGKNNRDKAMVLSSQYDLGKYADVHFADTEAFESGFDKSKYDVIVVDEAHALNKADAWDLYSNTGKGQIVYGLGDSYQSSFSRESMSVPPIYNLSMRTLPLSVTYRQNNNPYMLFLSWTRGLVTDSKGANITSTEKYRGFSSEYSPSKMEGVRSVSDLSELIENFISSFTPDRYGNHVMITGSKAEAGLIADKLGKDPRLAGFDPRSLVYHMENGDGSALGAGFRSIFVDIHPDSPNYAKLLYTAASRGTDYIELANVSGVISKEVVEVQHTDEDQGSISRSKNDFSIRQSELGDGLVPVSPVNVSDKSPSSKPKKETTKTSKSKKSTSPEVFDLDKELVKNKNSVPVINVSMDGTLSKGNPKLWVYGNLLKQGKMALMTGAQSDGRQFGSDPAEAVYRASLVDAISSGVFGSNPKASMFKQEVNGRVGYEYRLILEEDGLLEVKKIAKRSGFKGDDRALSFVGRVAMNSDSSADAAWDNVLSEYIDAIHEIGGPLDDGAEIPNSTTGISFHRPGAPILTDIPKGEKLRPTNSLSKITTLLMDEGNVVEGPFLGKNSNSDPIPYLLSRRKGLPRSLNTEVWGRMPNVDSKFFDSAIEELNSMTPAASDNRESMEKTLAYHYVRFNRSILVDRDRSGKETRVRSFIGKYFKLAPNAETKGPIFKHAKDENGISSAIDARKALIETMGDLKKQLGLKNEVVASTFVPFRVVSQGGKRLIDPRDAALLQFPVQRVNFPMAVIENKFTISKEDELPNNLDDSEPITGFMMSDDTDSVDLVARTFAPVARQRELASRVYGDRFINGVLEFKPREISGLYGLMSDKTIEVYFDKDGNIREGVIDHEAMHWIMQNSLDNGTYRSILQEAKYRISEEEEISDIDLISDVKANEWLAEEYRKNLPPSGFISRVLSFIRKVLMRLGLYRPDINVLFSMASSGSLTTSAEPSNSQPNFEDDLSMSGLLSSEDGGDASIKDELGETVVNESSILSGPVSSASQILLQHFPDGIFQVAKSMFANGLIDRTEYAPIKNELSFFKAPSRIKDGSIQNFKKLVTQQRLSIAGKMKDLSIQLADGTTVFFDELNKDNLRDAIQSISDGRYTNPVDLAPSELLKNYVVSVIGTDSNMKKSGDPDYAVFAAMVKSVTGGVKYQSSESNDFAQQEKSFRQGDASSDSLSPFGDQSMLMKTILINRPLLYPQEEGSPARQRLSGSDSFSPQMVDPKTMTQVMNMAMSEVRQVESTSPSDPLNISSSTTEEIVSLLGSELNKIYRQDPGGHYGIHAFTAMQIMTSGDHHLLSDGKTKVYSYGRAYKALLNKKQVSGSLTESESAWMNSLSQTLNNLISPFKSAAGINGLRHETIPGGKKTLSNGIDAGNFPTRVSRRYFSSDIEQQVQNEMNRKIKSVWTGRGNGVFKFADMWEYFDIHGDRKPRADVGFRIIRSGDDVVLSSTGRNEVELVRSGSTRQAAFRSLPDHVVNEKNPEMRSMYASLYARFFSYAGFPIAERTTFRLLYSQNTKDHNLLADAVGHWAVQVKRGMVAMSSIAIEHGDRNSKLTELSSIDTSLEDSIAIQKQNALSRSGVFTDSFGEITSDRPGVSDESSDSFNTPLPLPSDLFNINVELYMANQYGRGNSFDMQMLNGNGGRSNLQAYTSTLRELLSVNFSKFNNADEARLFLLKATGDPDVASTIPFGIDVGLKPALYFGMRAADGSEGSNLDGMEETDVTQAFAYEFMNGLRYMHGSKSVKFTVPSSLIGDRDKNLANELNLTGGRFGKLFRIRTGKWGKNAPSRKTKNGDPIESIDFNHQLFTSEFLIPQFQKFNKLREKSINRVVFGLINAESVLSSIGVKIDIPNSIKSLSDDSTDQRSRAYELWGVITKIQEKLSDADKLKFAAALQLPGSSIIIGTDLIINRNGEIAVGSDIAFNYSSVFNSRNWEKVKGMSIQEATQWTKMSFEGSEDSYVSRIQKQWVDAKVQLPRLLANAISIGKEGRIISEAARAYAYSYLMNDAWTHDLLFGPYGNMAKPNSVSRAGRSSDLYMDNMGRSGMALSSGTQSIPNPNGISSNINTIMYEDGVWELGGNEIHDGASMSLPHHYEDMNQGLGGPASIASATSMKTVSMHRGRIIKHSQERISPSSYAQSLVQKEITDRAYSVNSEIEAAWSPVASYDLSDPRKVDMRHFERVFNESVQAIRNLRSKVILADETDPGSAYSIGSILGDVVSPRSAIKTKQEGIQYLSAYHSESLPEFISGPLQVSFSTPSNRTFVQLNAERDLDRMRAPRQTQQFAWMGVTSDGYALTQPIDDLWGRYVDNEIGKMRSSMGKLEPGKKASPSQMDRVAKKVKGLILGSISPDNYMGQVTSVLMDENVSLNNPIIASIVRSTLSKVIRRSITNPRTHGNLYVSVPGHFEVWQDGEEQSGGMRPMAPNEVLMPFSHISTILPVELREEGKYMTLQQVREIVMEEAMKYASSVYKDQAMADLYISQKSAEFDELLTVYVSRTPSNLVSGSAVLRVAGFISDQGNTIAVHPELNRLTGADHDIDQWTVQQYKTIEVMDEASGSRTWSVDRPKEGSGDISLDQMNNLTLDLIREYHASESDSVQNRLKSVITGTQKFTEAYSLLTSGESSILEPTPKWMQDLGNPAAFAPSVKAVNAGKSLVGSFMNASKSWAYIMRSANKAQALGMSIDEFRNSYTPGMPIFKDGQSGAELIDENFSALANQSLDDYKTLMAMGSLNITTDNVNVIIGAIASGVPLVEAMSLGRGPVLSAIKDLMSYSNSHTRNAGDRSRHNVYSAIESARKNNAEFIHVNHDEVNAVESYFFIGTALNMAGAVFSHDSRSSWTFRSNELADLNAIRDLTGKTASEILNGTSDPSVVAPSRKLNKERSKIVSKVRSVFNLANLLREGNAPDGRSDLSDVGRRFLKSIVLENDINNATFLENSNGAIDLTERIRVLTGRKSDLSEEAQKSVSGLLRDVSLIRSIESLEDQRVGQKPGRVVHLTGRKYDLSNVRHQALFVHSLSEAITQRIQEVSSDIDHHGNQLLTSNMFLSQLTVSDGSALLVMRNANMFKDPIDRENMRNAFTKIDQILSDKNGVLSGDEESTLSTTHTIQEMLALYSVLNDKLDFKSSSFARFVDPARLSWVNDGFHELASILSDPEKATIDTLDGNSISGTGFIHSVLLPAALRDPKLKNDRSSRSTTVVGGVYTSSRESSVKPKDGPSISIPYELVMRKSNGPASGDVVLRKSTSSAGLPFSSDGHGLEENTQVIYPTDKASFKKIMNGDPEIHLDIKHNMNKGLKVGPAMTPFGPVVIKSISITNVGVRLSLDASKLSFSHGSYSNTSSSYSQPSPDSFPKHILSKLNEHEEVSAETVLNALSKSGNPFIDTLSKAMLSRVADVRIKSIMSGPGSMYDNSTGQVWVSDQDLAKSPHAVLLHEIIHGYTASIFASEQSGHSLTESEGRFMSAMSDIREEFLQLKDSPEYKQLSDRQKRVIDHAGSSVSEFVSGILAEPDVRDFIASADTANESVIPGSNSPNLWQKFWSWILDLLGISQENSPFSESMIERSFYAFKEFVQDVPGETISEGMSMRMAPDGPVDDIRELATEFKSGRHIGAVEDISAKNLEEYLIANSSYYYKPDKKKFVFQGAEWTVRDPSDLNRVIKDMVVPFVKAYDLRERKVRLVSVLNNSATPEEWLKNFSKVNARREESQLYDQGVQDSFLDKLKYDRDPSAFYFLYSELKDPETVVTNSLGNTLRIGSSGLKFIKGLQGYDPIVKVIPKKGTSGSTVSFFDVTSSSFTYRSSDRKGKLFQSHTGRLSNTAVRNSLTSSEGHVRGFMAGLAAAASIGDNVTIADIKAIQLTRNKVVSATVSMFDTVYNLKVMKERTPFFSRLPGDARANLEREGIERVLDQAASVHAYRSMIEERLLSSGMSGMDDTMIPVSVSAAYRTLIDRIDGFHARQSGSYLLLREGITDRIQFIRSARKRNDTESYSAENELETLEEMLLEIDGFDKRFVLGKRFSETFLGQFKTSHNLSDPAMQQMHAKMVDGQHEVSARSKIFQDQHKKVMNEFSKAIGWNKPDELIGGGWKKYDVLFVRSSTSPNDTGPKVYDQEGKLIVANTGEMHWDKYDPRTAKLLRENKLTEAHLKYSNWLLDQIADMMTLQILHTQRMDTTSQFWKGIVFNEKAAMEWSRASAENRYPRGWIPIVLKGLNEALSKGDFKGAGNAMLRRMENTSRIIDDEVLTAGELQAGMANNTFMGELFPSYGSGSETEHVSIGKDGRVMKLGLSQRMDGDYTLVDEHVNSQVSHDPEHLANQFMVSGWRSIVHDRKTIPAYEAYMSVEGRQSDQNSSNASNMKLFADSLISGKQSGSPMRISGMNATTLSNAAYGFNSITRLALNVPVWFGNIIYNTTTSYRTAIANSIVGSDLFGVDHLSKAMKMSSFDLISKEQRLKIKVLTESYKVFEMSEVDATRNYRRMVNDKAVWSSHIMHIGNWGGDFQIRAAVMIAQMLKDGSWEAHGVDTNGNMTYDIKKDKRFYEGGKRVKNSEMIESAIRERLISDYLVDQKPEGPLARGYDTRMAKIFTYATNKYVIGGMDSLSQTAADNLWYIQPFLQFRRFLPDKLSNAFQPRMSTDLGGHWEIDKENGKEIAKWVPREAIGYVGAMLEAVGMVKQIATMPRSEWKSLDIAAKESLARFVADVAIALGALLMYEFATGGFGDDDDKQWWQKENAFNRRFLYAAQDLFAYTPGLLHENMFKNAVPAADMVAGWWDLIAGKDFEKAANKALWNVPGRGTWKAFSDLYTAEEVASRTDAENRAEKRKRAEERELEALEGGN